MVCGAILPARARLMVLPFLSAIRVLALACAGDGGDTRRCPRRRANDPRAACSTASSAAANASAASERTAQPVAQPGQERAVSGSDVVLQLERLEGQIRQLTGAIEQLQFRNQQLEQQVRRMQEDTEYRFQELGSKGTARPAPARPQAGPAACADRSRRIAGAGGTARRCLRPRAAPERARRAANAWLDPGRRAASRPGRRRAGGDVPGSQRRSPIRPIAAGSAGAARHAHRRRLRAAARPRKTSTISPTAMCCARTMRSPRKPSATS